MSGRDRQESLMEMLEHAPRQQIFASGNNYGLLRFRHYGLGSRIWLVPKPSCKKSVWNLSLRFSVKLTYSVVLHRTKPRILRNRVPSSCWYAPRLLFNPSERYPYCSWLNGVHCGLHIIPSPSY